MITQQYLLDPLTPEQRQKLDERIQVLERTDDAAAREVLESLYAERAASVPRLVPYDPRVHP